MEFINAKSKNKDNKRCAYCGEYLRTEEEIRLGYHPGAYACACKKKGVVIEKAIGLYIRADRQKKRYYENKK